MCLVFLRDMYLEHDAKFFFTIYRYTCLGSFHAEKRGLMFGAGKAKGWMKMKLSSI